MIAVEILGLLGRYVVYSTDPTEQDILTGYH